ncbi:MAG: sigma-70 family RNA polymerase sigma factor [Myxococcota bacterium]
MNDRAASNPNPESRFDRNAMILEYYPLVKSIAYRLVSRFPSNVDVEDLITVGTLGLIDAIDRYNPERQDSFKAYAELRIRGAIIDALRQQDWVPRSQRQRAQELERAQRDLERQLGRVPAPAEVATHLGMELEEYNTLTRSTTLMSVVSLEDLGLQDDQKRDILEVLKGESDDPDSIFEAKTATEKLATAIRSLPQNEKVVVSLYYYEDLTLKDIGQVLGVTESRVSQIHSKAVERLKVKLKKLEYN